MTKRGVASQFLGRVQVYTGDGKGKTTAALGLAFRAAGRGFRTYIGQFCKGRKTGELEAARRLAPLIVIEQFGRPLFLRGGEKPAAKDIDRARRGLACCREAMHSGDFRIVVLDEIALAVYFGLLPEAEILGFLDARPKDVEIVLTGRKMPPSLLRRADLVTDMRERKHYFAQGVVARHGIED